MEQDVDIIIPSCKNIEECYEQIDNINNTRKTKGQLIFTGLKESASKNRNKGLKDAQSQIVIQLDDDTKGFYDGWDMELINPLLNFSDTYSIVAARLMNDKNEPTGQLGDCGKKIIPLEDITIAMHTEKTKLNITGSSCIAFQKQDDLWFDENYLGATWEDADFCMEFKKKYPHKKIIINNKCRLIHLMESKGRIINGINVSNKNRLYFQKKWNIYI